MLRIYPCNLNDPCVNLIIEILNSIKTLYCMRNQISDNFRYIHRLNMTSQRIYDQRYLHDAVASDNAVHNPSACRYHDQ